MTNPRHLNRADLVEAMDEVRALTLAATLPLSDEQWTVPYHPGIQPIAWDLLHVAWFAEFWLLRGPHRLDLDGTMRADRHERITGNDEQYDSARVSHRARWEMELFPREALLDRLARQLNACKAKIGGGGITDRDLYQGRFAVYHELMHHEALAWACDLLSYPAPPGLVMPEFEARAAVDVPGGSFRIGRHPDELGFAFDNELPGRTVKLNAFSIDAAPVTNAQFLAFVQEGGYRRLEFWPGAAGQWLAAAQREAPERWRRLGNGNYAQRWFKDWQPLALAQPVVHVNAFEAEAYCRFVGRRLPRAAEWEVAAARITWGHSVWEWTADDFAPYPGFRPAPYTTYSAPWFHFQRELRGGAFATHRLVHDQTYRNFFLPQRTDVFAGFRTAADT